VAASAAKRNAQSRRGVAQLWRHRYQQHLAKPSIEQLAASSQSREGRNPPAVTAAAATASRAGTQHREKAAPWRRHHDIGVAKTASDGVA